MQINFIVKVSGGASVGVAGAAAPPQAVKAKSPLNAIIAKVQSLYMS